MNSRAEDHEKREKYVKGLPDVVHKVTSYRYWRSEGEDGSDIGEAAMLPTRQRGGR